MGRIAGVIGIVAALLLSSCEPLALKSTIMELSDPPTWELSQAPLMGGGAGDQFGRSVDMSENYMIVGANFSEEGGTNRGAAYIYNKGKDGTWVFQQKITAETPLDGDQFGRAVAISENFALVCSSNVNRVEVFIRSGSTWTKSDELIEIVGYFGQTLDIDGDYCIIGDYLNHDVYFYKYNGTDEWTYDGSITKADGSFHGESVSIKGNYAVVGAPLHKHNGTETASGAVYIYQRSALSWNEANFLETESPAVNDYFGWSVSISDDSIVVGALGLSSVYFYQLAGSVWEYEQQISIPGLVPSDKFGLSVSVSGRAAVAGAPGLSGDTGSAYAFERYGDQWIYKGPVTYSKNETDDNFGDSVATNGSVFVIGAYNDDNLNGTSAGSSYVFTRK